MIPYHEEHPLQYIGVISLTYGITATFWADISGHLQSWKRFRSIICLIIITIVLASIPGGILWRIHDMQAGFFPSGNMFLNHLIDGVGQGLTIGWLIILLSLPYNLLGLFAGYIVTDKVQKKFLRQFTDS